MLFRNLVTFLAEKLESELIFLFEEKKRWCTKFFALRQNKLINKSLYHAS